MRFSVFIEIYYGFAVFGEFLCGFAVSNRPQRPPPFSVPCFDGMFRMDHVDLLHQFQAFWLSQPCQTSGSEKQMHSSLSITKIPTQLKYQEA